MLKKIGYVAFLAMAILACKPRDFNSDGSTPEDITYHNGAAGDSPHWVYNGPLPHLKNVRVVASMKGHTVRIEGDVPSSFNEADLPFYAFMNTENGARRVSVVYPIGSPDVRLFSEFNPTQHVKSYPVKRSKVKIYVRPFRAYVGPPHPAAWGGFPFLAYNPAAGVAFHGPITASSNGKAWHLRRGDVSHGCKRMQGEHAVEMAHLLGVEMTDVIPKNAEIEVDLTVMDFDEGYDVLDWGPNKGKFVDVDYQTWNGAARPVAAKTFLYPTWSGNDYPRLVCEYNSKRPLGQKHCEYKGPFVDFHKQVGAAGSVTGGLGANPELIVGLGKANSHICGAGVNLRSEQFDEIGEAENALPVWAYPETKVNPDNNLPYVHIGFKNDHLPNDGWVAQKYVCAGEK